MVASAGEVVHGQGLGSARMAIESVRANSGAEPLLCRGFALLNPLSAGRRFCGLWHALLADTVGGVHLLQGRRGAPLARHVMVPIS